MSVNRRDLIRYLEEDGFWLLREGGNHSIYTNGAKVISVKRQLLSAFANMRILEILEAYEAKQLFSLRSLLRKGLMGCASLHPSYGSFHGLGCPRGT
jgi:hypothetical protein